VTYLGYADEEYGLCFSGLAAPLYLKNASANLLCRSIEGVEIQDAMGAYPLLACGDWSLLAADLADLPGSLVSVTAVSDPLADCPPETLKNAFPDLCVPYKEHFLVDLQADPAVFVHSHHRRNVAKSLAKLTVREQAGESIDLERWLVLYDSLIDRHQIAGIARFSRDYFKRLKSFHSSVVLTAYLDGAAVGMMWCIRTRTDVYYHLAAYDQAGYDSRASFALFWTAIDMFKRLGLRFLALGAGAGVYGTSEGLSRFKAGWATGTRTAFLCGRIINKTAYEQLARERISQNTGYFPAYRG
jgi:hypothetical protein